MSLLRALNCIFQVKTVARDDNNYLIGLLCKCSEMTGVKYLTMCSVLSITLRPPWTVALQGPLCVEFSRQEYWSGLPFPTPVSDFMY